MATQDQDLIILPDMIDNQDEGQDEDQDQGQGQDQGQDKYTTPPNQGIEFPPSKTTMSNQGKPPKIRRM